MFLFFGLHPFSISFPHLHRYAPALFASLHPMFFIFNINLRYDFIRPKPATNAIAQQRRAVGQPYPMLVPIANTLRQYYNDP